MGFESFSYTWGFISVLVMNLVEAEMEREVQKKVLTVAKKTSATMTKKTGVEASMKDDDMKTYVELVMKALRSSNNT